MSGSEIIAPLLLKAAEKAVIEGGKYGLKKFFSGSVVSLAIQSTSKEFPNIPVVERSLKKWCGSDEFASLLEEVRAGHNNKPDESLIDSFIQVGEFFDGLTKTHDSARRVLSVFAEHLEKELYKSEDAHYIEAQRSTIRHKENQEGFRNISDQIAEIPTRLVNAIQENFPISAFDLETSPAVQEKIHSTTMELAFGLLQEGKAKSARAILEKLRSDIASNNPSTDLQFRLAVNLGMCSLQLNEIAPALAEFEFALRLKPDNKTALSKAAVAAMAEGKKEQALDYARRSWTAGEKDTNITANFLRVLYFAGEIEELERVITEEEWVPEDPKCAFVLGMIRLDQGKAGEAEKHLTTSISRDYETPHAPYLLAQSIVINIEQQLANDPPLNWRWPPEIKDQLNRAEEQLERALEKFQNYENVSIFHDALILRSNVLRLLGKEKEALQICERVLAADPIHVDALKHKGQLLLMSGRVDEAIESLQKLPVDEISDGPFISIAHAYREKKEYGKVAEFLARYWKPSLSGRQQLIIADMLLSAYHHLSETAKVAEVLDGLRRERSDDPDALALISRQLVREGKKDEANGQLLDALGKVSSDSQRQRISLELAEYYYHIENWAEAARFFSQILDTTSDGDLLRKYLLSLYKAGLYREALAISQQLRGDGDAIPFISEIEARILEWVGDLQASLNLYERLSRVETRAAAYRVGVVRLKNRLGDQDGARSTLSEIDYEDVKDDGLLLMQVAQFRQHLGLGDELRYAYRARRLKSNDPESHLAYIGLFLNRSPGSARDLDIAEVAVGCAVKLVDARGQEKLFVIEDETPDATRNEISSADPRALILLGHHTGDEIVFNPGEFDESRFSITEVKSKYVHAFQQTLLEFRNWFTHPGLRAMDVRDDDFSGFFAMLDRQYQRNSQVLGLYKEKIPPLGTLARMLGRNLFEIWGGLTHSVGSRLHVSTGILERLAHEDETLKKANAIVLDLSALLTMNFLGLLDKLPLLFNRLIVSRPVIDELNEWLTPQIGESKPAMMVWKDERGYVREDITREMLESRRRFLEDIREFINNKASVVPVNKALDLSREQIDQYEEVLGAISTSSILVAHELNIPLYTDDLGLSMVANHEWGVTCCSTQAILLRMKNRGLFSAVRYWEALRTLILGNYFYISVTGDALWWMCEQNQKKATAEIQHILKQTLQGPDCDLRSALPVGAQFIYRVWMDVFAMDDKLSLIDLVTGAIVTGRDRSQAKSALKAMVARRFGPYQSPLPMVFTRIDEYERDEAGSVDRSGEKQSSRDDSI
jgi:tetratricopeptide (TPR) repeat protein/predicted nucleic acid-binding protein